MPLRVDLPPVRVGAKCLGASGQMREPPHKVRLVRVGVRARARARARARVSAPFPGHGASGENSG